MANLIEKLLSMLADSQMQGPDNRLAAAGQMTDQSAPIGGLLGQLFGGGGSNELVGSAGGDQFAMGVNEGLSRGQAGTPTGGVLGRLLHPRVTPGDGNRLAMAGGPDGDRPTDPITARINQAFGVTGGGPAGGLTPLQAAEYAESHALPPNAPMPTARPDGARPDLWAGLREVTPQPDPMTTASTGPARPASRGLSQAMFDDAGSMGNPQVQAALASHQNGGFSQRRPVDLSGNSGADISLGGNASGATGPTDRLETRGGSQGGGFGGFLQNLFDPQSKARNEAVTWLMRQGLDQGSASYLSQNPEALRSYLNDYVKGSRPDWQMQTIYDDAGNEQRVLMDMNNPGSIKPIGGAKTNLKTPAELAQAKDIAAAGKSELKLPTLENEYDKTLGKSYGERFTEIQKEAQTAQRAINSLSVMEQVMGNEGFYSGTAADQVKRIKQFGAALGFDASGVQDMETFSALSKQAALDVMGGSLGTGFSNADRDFVTGQVPQLENTPQGNKQLIDIQRKLARRKQEIAKLAREYAAKNGNRIDPGFDDYLAQWAERNPLFPALPKNPGNENGPGRVRNPQPGALRPRATNPAGDVIEFDGTQWVPVQ